MAYRDGSMLLQQQVEDAGRPAWQSRHAEPAAAELLRYCVQALTRRPLPAYFSPRSTVSLQDSPLLEAQRWPTFAAATAVVTLFPSMHLTAPARPARSAPGWSRIPRRRPDGSAAEDVTFGSSRSSRAMSWRAWPGRSVRFPACSCPIRGPTKQVLAITKPSSDEMPAAAERGDRYQLFGEIARGGMGAVLKGRDPDLGRDLARQGPAREPRGQARTGAPVRGGSADRRPAPASRHRAGVRAGDASPTAGPISR